jgi:DNA-binding response OmpR family regulator
MIGDYKRILIIEDYEGILFPMKLALELEGFEVDFTTEGNRAIEKILEFSPSLVFMDILLAGIDGREIVNNIKNHPLVREDIKIIMMSANSKFKNTALNCGANDFLEKPFDMEDLLEKIKLHLPD